MYNHLNNEFRSTTTALPFSLLITCGTHRLNRVLEQNVALQQVKRGSNRATARLTTYSPSHPLPTYDQPLKPATTQTPPLHTPRPHTRRGSARSHSNPRPNQPDAVEALKREAGNLAEIPVPPEGTQGLRRVASRGYQSERRV